MRKATFSVLMLAVAVPAGAQNSLPGLENFTLERPLAPQPTPTATPTPVPSASPTAVPTPPAATPSPSPSATPTPRATASASPRPSVTPSPTSSPNLAEPTPPPVVAQTPEPVATPAATSPASAPAAAGGRWPWWIAAALAVAAALVAGWWYRRRNAHAEIWEEPRSVPAAPARPPMPAPPTPVPAAPKPAGGLVTVSLRPALAIDLRPLGAGIDTLRATVDFVLTVRNTGRAAAQAVAVQSWLIGAGSDPRGELAELLALPPGQPMMPPFMLPAAANAELNGQGATARELLATITAGERTLLVPLIAVRATYQDGRGQPLVATAAFLIGVERPGQERLAPLALDRGVRVYQSLAVRRYEI